MCSLITGQAWHFAPCLRVACASSFVEGSTRHVYHFPSPHPRSEPSQKDHFIHSPNPFFYHCTVAHLPSIWTLSPPPQPVLHLSKFSPGPSYTAWRYLSSSSMWGQIWNRTWRSGIFFSFISFIYATGVLSHKNWMSCPKPSETKESKPNTPPHCWVTVLAIVCLRMTHWFFPLWLGLCSGMPR